MVNFDGTEEQYLQLKPGESNTWKFFEENEQEIEHNVDPIEASLSLNKSKVSKIEKEDLILHALMSIRPTSTEVERLFSTCSLLISPRRSKIKTDLLNAILICRKL